MAHVTTSIDRVHVQQRAPAVAATTKSAPRTSAAASDFRALFTSSSPTVTPAAAPAAAPAPALSTAAPTPESVFGANPWETNPQGLNPNGSTFSYNPIYFATANTAAQVAKMLGGTVTESDALAPNAQEQPNYMVQMPDGRSINAGLVASFYSHGYPQSYVDGLIASEINGTNT
jgi:hypothetical protein